MLHFFKFIISVILFSVTLKASVLTEKVENIIGTKDYNIHSSLIHLLFQDESKYIINDKIKYHNLFKTLQENGLLNLKLAHPSNIEIEFKTINNNFKSYKILNEVMNALGYRYFFTKSMDVLEEKNLNWNIMFKAEYMPDPVMLIRELRYHGSNLISVQNNGQNKWSYEIDFKNTSLTNVIKIDKNEKVKFQKPLRAYMLKVDNPKSLEVFSKNLNYWYPHIVFFDKNLKVIQVIKKNRVYRGLKIQLPSDTRYIKITDMYNLINIKRGLSVIVR